MLANSLLERMKLPSVARADDFKFVGDITIYSHAEIQAEVDTVADWSEEISMPLSVEKSVVMHCGVKQSNYDYTLYCESMKAMDSFTDLGVICSSNGGYSGHCQAMVTKATKMAGAIRRVFWDRRHELLWVAFQCYILPTLKYCAPAWYPYLQRDIDLVERVQRRFTKRISGLESLSYEDRLKSLNAMSLRNLRAYASMVVTYKSLSCIMAEGFDLSRVVSCMRGNGIRINQRRTKTRAANSFFTCRAPKE